jgi:hypothetical protein
MPLDHVQSGQPLSLPAADWNGAMDAARAWQQRRGGAPTGAGGVWSDLSGIVLVKNSSGVDRSWGDVLGLGAPVFGPGDNEADFRTNPIFIGSTPAAGTHEGRFAVLLGPIPNGSVGRGLVSGPVAVHVNTDVGDEGVTAFADVCDGETGFLKTKAGGSARILWRNAGTGSQWAWVLLGAGTGGPKLCTSDEWGGIGPGGADGAADVTPQEGDDAGDVVSGSGHMFDETIDWNDPPEEMLTPEQGGIWNPQVSLNLGKWLRDNWIPANAGAIITALGDSFNTAINTAIGTYMTAHAGDVVGPAVTVWLGDNVATVVNAILADPGELFCMDDVAPVAADATGDGTNAQHFRIDGHLHTDLAGVLNPHSYVDPTKIFCSVDDAEAATPITGTDTTGNLVLRGSIFWDGTASRWNIISLIDPYTFLCIEGVEGTTITPAGTLFINGHFYPEAEGGPFNPRIPFPPGDDTWVEVDAANGIIKHIGPGPSVYNTASNGIGMLTALDLDAKGHVRSVSYCTATGVATIGPSAP